MDDKDLEEKIAEVKAIKRFGEEELGLEYGEAFTRVELNPPSPMAAYWVYASPKDEISVLDLNDLAENKPYISFFDKEATLTRKRELEAEGFDTYLFSAEVYGGLDDCPILPALLKQPLHHRAFDILHEGFHILHQKKGWNLPYCLEEPIASYVGFIGAYKFLQSTSPSEVPILLNQIKRHGEWTRLINKHTKELCECYEQGGCPDEILESLQWRARGFGVHDKINNAFILRQMDYRKNAPLIWETLKGTDLREYIANPDEINAFLLERIAEES